MDAAAATIAVISDTHFPRRGPSLPEVVVERLGAADLIVHAGDWSNMATVRMVRALGRSWDPRALRGSVEYLSWDDVGRRYHSLLLDVMPERSEPSERVLASAGSYG